MSAAEWWFFCLGLAPVTLWILSIVVEKALNRLSPRFNEWNHDIWGNRRAIRERAKRVAEWERKHGRPWNRDEQWRNWRDGHDE